MILIVINIDDNSSIMTRGIFKKAILAICILFIGWNCSAAEKIGIVTDTLLTPINYYNAYYRTPEFFASDIRYELYKRGVDVVSVDVIENALKNSGLKQTDFESLQTLSQGYNLEYKTLKKIAGAIGVKKLVVVTMGIDIQRDFLKNTLWNSLNISGMDVVNPTHRVSVYVGLVDVQKEHVLWESIYAKNIRNNKMKNLDTTISNNYEGMLRLKEYSKYISPDIAYNVKMKMLNPNYVEPPTAITRENLKQYAKDKHNIGVKKELSELERQKWDTEKLKEDTKENIVEFSKNTKEHAVDISHKTKNGFIKFKDKVQRKFKKIPYFKYDKIRNYGYN